MSFAGYDRLSSDLEAIGRLGGKQNIDKALGAMLLMAGQGKDFIGLVDAKRPWGVVALTDGRQQFAVYGYVPTTKLKQIMDMAKEHPLLAGGIQLNDGMYEVQAGAQTVYVKQKGDWAVAPTRARIWPPAPALPLTFFGELVQEVRPGDSRLGG